MRPLKAVTTKNYENRARAIEAHAGFVSYVVGKVKKIGIEEVLKQHSNGLAPPTEFYWLKKSYERVLKFAEDVQIKELPSKVVTEDEEGKTIPLTVYIPEVNGK